MINIRRPALTDIFNDREKKEAQQTKSFKEKILADMKKAKQSRKNRDVSQVKKGNVAKDHQKYSDSAVQKQDKEETRTVMPIPEGNITDKDVDNVLANLDEIFAPGQLNHSDQINEKENSQQITGKQSSSLKTGSATQETETFQSKESLTLPNKKTSENKVSDVLEVKVKKTNNWVDDGEAENWQLPDLTEKLINNNDEETKELPLSNLTEKTNSESEMKHSVKETEELLKQEKKLSSKYDKTKSQTKVSSKEKDVTANLNQKRQQHYKKTNRLAKKISTVLITFILILLLGTGLFGYYYVSSAIKPLDAHSTRYIQVEIPSGSGNRMIGKILEKAGVIKNATVFNFYTKFRNYSNLQSGYYNLQKSMSLDDIAKTLKNGGTTTPQAPVLGKVVIPEGYTIKQISKAITSNANTKKKTDKTPFTAKEFLKTVKDKAFIEKMVKKYPRLLGSLPDASKVTYQFEGYLFPATYSYGEKTSIEDLIDNMLAAMDTNMQSYYDTIESQGKTVNDILTLASLVEKEGATDDDRKKIAGIFYNRINQDMPLQSNIAILYAMGKLGEKTSLKEDATINTKIDSPYNVYTNKGLMPGAVDNPSLSAIKAAVEPESTDDLYFVADVTTGEVHYAKTYEEHSANVEKYVNKKVASSSDS